MKSTKKLKFVSFFYIFIALFAFFINCGNLKKDYVCASNVINSSAKAMAVIEKTTGRLLYSKHENEKLPMASLTKIITAIYVIDNTEDFDKKHEIPKEAVGIEGTTIGLKEGEHLSVKELLYGLMLRSGNDSAVALAIITCGSESSFVLNVNEWLKDKGFLNTQIKNPHGLHNDSHYTTAYELAKITAYALSNETFQEIVSTKQTNISNEKNSKVSRTLNNKNKLLLNYEFADGVKTGFTKKAGRCFVGSATKNGMQLICVLLNCVPMFEECENLLNKAFNEYELKKVLTKGDVIGEVIVKNSKDKKCVLTIPNDFYYPLKKDELKDIVLKFSPKEELKAPINIGDELANIEINLQNQLIFLDKIYSIKYIDANTFNSKFQRIMEKM